MAYTHGTIAAGSYGAHKELVAAIATAAVAAGWTVMRQTAGSDSVEAEVILHSTGYSGTENIYVGFKTYTDIYYRRYHNVNIGVFTGYSAGSDFSAQPGVIRRGIGLTKKAFDYHFAINPQRIAFALNLFNTMWQTAIGGYGIRHCLPSEYPNPLMIAGMMDADQNQSCYSSFNTSQLSLGSSLGVNRDPAVRTIADDTWQNVRSFANVCNFAYASNLNNGQQALRAIQLVNENTPRMYMEVDGFYHIATFEAVPGSKITIGSTDYLVVPSWGFAATQHGSMLAMRLD